MVSNNPSIFYRQEIYTCNAPRWNDSVARSHHYLASKISLTHLEPRRNYVSRGNISDCQYSESSMLHIWRRVWSIQSWSEIEGTFNSVGDVTATSVISLLYGPGGDGGAVGE